MFAIGSHVKMPFRFDIVRGWLMATTFDICATAQSHIKGDCELDTRMLTLRLIHRTLYRPQFRDKQHKVCHSSRFVAMTELFVVVRFCSPDDTGGLCYCCWFFLFDFIPLFSWWLILHTNYVSFAIDKIDRWLRKSIRVPSTWNWFTPKTEQEK